MPGTGPDACGPAGGRELVNFMDIDDARAFLGGAYEFMGVAVSRKELATAALRNGGTRRGLAAA